MFRRVPQSQTHSPDSQYEITNPRRRYANNVSSSMISPQIQRPVKSISNISYHPTTSIRQDRPSVQSGAPAQLYSTIVKPLLHVLAKLDAAALRGDLSKTSNIDLIKWREMYSRIIESFDSQLEIVCEYLDPPKNPDLRIGNSWNINIHDDELPDLIEKIANRLRIGNGSMTSSQIKANRRLFEEEADKSFPKSPAPKQERMSPRSKDIKNVFFGRVKSPQPRRNPIIISDSTAHHRYKDSYIGTPTREIAQPQVLYGEKQKSKSNTPISRTPERVVIRLSTTPERKVVDTSRQQAEQENEPEKKAVSTYSFYNSSMYVFY